ncbi:hypothetical protein GXW82_35450 [Streptacidiphilus sp. 4-A2]|nr:hypothetical protein [Streptacidiphilus sp. 4-A2]
MTAEGELTSELVRPQLSEVLPDFAEELARLLRAEGEHQLADDIGAQRFYGWCTCTDDFCQSFRTAPEPNGAYGPGHRSIPLLPERHDQSSMSSMAR